MRFATYLGFAGLLLLFALGLTGCQSKAERRQEQAQHLKDEYNKAMPELQKCLGKQDDPALTAYTTGKTLTNEQLAAIEAKEKATQARCKPYQDRIDQINREAFELDNTPIK